MTTAITIPLSRGYVALISPEDAPRVLPYKWSLHKGEKGKLYACRNERVTLPDGRVVQRKKLLHRTLMNATPEQEIDHENGDGLDCRRDNLRVATRAQNVANTPSRKGARCEYKGVYVRTGGKRWRAEITVHGHKRDLGTYRCPEQAARAYDIAALEAWGEFAYLNFPQLRPLYRLGLSLSQIWRARPRVVCLTQ